MLIIHSMMVYFVGVVYIRCIRRRFYAVLLTATPWRPAITGSVVSVPRERRGVLFAPLHEHVDMRVSLLYYQVLEYIYSHLQNMFSEHMMLRFVIEVRPYASLDNRISRCLCRAVKKKLLIYYH